jgi:hypothetical protein
MSEFENRQQALQSVAEAARINVSGVVDEHPQYREQMERLDAVLAYAITVISRSDFRLVGDAIYEALMSTLVALRDQAQTQTAAVAQNAATHGSNVLDYLARFPPAKGRLREQAIVGMLADFQREAQRRLDALMTEISGVRTSMKAAEEDEANRLAALDATITERTASFNEAVTETQRSIGVQRQQLEQALTDQAERFRAAQDERNESFKEQFEKVENTFDQTASEAHSRLNAAVSDIERMREESAQLVGAIGITGTAERYDEEAKTQRAAADSWRRAAVLLALLAVAIGCWAAFEGDQETANLAGKLTIGIVLGGVAAYAARQSARHRGREEDARAIQLDLAAFQPFIELLPEAQQHEERIALGRKLFGHRFTRKDVQDPEGGPSALGALLGRGGDTGADV